MNMKLKYKVRKYVGIPVLCVLLTMGITGCAGLSYNEMQEQGKQLLKEGNEMNESLVKDAQEMNGSIEKSNSKIGIGWISVLEKISEDNGNYRIKYALEDDLENKSSIHDIEDFIDNVDLKEWTQTDEFPKDINNTFVFFIQEKTNDKTSSKYKNIANLRFLKEDNLIIITVAAGLIDLSDEFAPNNDSFTSVYKVPDSVIDYLLTVVE